MFEFDIERTLLTEENERKPNRYMALAMRLGLLTQTICFVLNELDIFHVDKTILRTCYVMVVVCAVIPQVIAYHKKLSVNPRCKYLVLGCVWAMTFLQMLALFIFSTPLCMLPMLLAVQYNSRKVTKMAIIGSCICVVFTPPLGCIMGLWDVSFLQYLISSARGAFVSISPADSISRLYVIGSLAAYVSFPWLLIVLMCSRLILSATQKGTDNIQNQIRILQMSRRDVLTGLYNQNVYREFLESEFEEGQASILFFDVDGLKATNDAYGHEKGDFLLRRCSDSLKGLFDDRCHGFRIGGDEFLVYLDSEDPQLADEKLKEWEKAMETVNRENRESGSDVFCHMSAGKAFGSKKDIGNLIDEADKRMYEEKQKYHQSLVG